MGISEGELVTKANQAVPSDAKEVSPMIDTSEKKTPRPRNERQNQQSKQFIVMMKISVLQVLAQDPRDKACENLHRFA